MQTQNEKDEARAKRVRDVFRRFHDEGVDRAAQLTVAFFMSEAADAQEELAYRLGQQ